MESIPLRGEPIRTGIQRKKSEMVNEKTTTTICLGSYSWSGTVLKFVVDGVGVGRDSSWRLRILPVKTSM